MSTADAHAMFHRLQYMMTDIVFSRLEYTVFFEADEGLGRRAAGDARDVVLEELRER